MIIRRALVILLLSCSIPSLARERPLIEIRSPHFRVLTDGSKEDGRNVALQFEQMRFVLADSYPTFRLEGGAPLVIFAARDESAAKSLRPDLWKQKGARPAGYFDPSWEKKFAMVRMDAIAEGQVEIVYHEYTHSVMHLNLHWIPLWLDEGLAEYYGFTQFDKRKIYVGAPPPIEQIKYLMGSLIPVETMLGVDQDSRYYHDEFLSHWFYAEAWALVHFMIFGPEMQHGELLNKFATLLQGGTEQKKAFEQTFGPVAQFDKAFSNYLGFVKYLNQSSFKAGVVRNPPNLNSDEFAIRTMTLADTHAELAGFHLWSNDFEHARNLAEQAIQEDAKLGLAHEVMGFIDFADGKDADALSEFSQACDLDPTLYLSLFAKTMMSPIASFSAPGDQDAAQGALLKVLKLNPQFAPAYVQLARLSVARGDMPNAIGLARKAEQLEPTRAGYHVLSGKILVRMGKPHEAADFAQFVAQRWPGPNHNEAVELWNSIPQDQRPAGVLLTEAAPALLQADSPENVQVMEGRVVSSACPGSAGEWTYTISREGQNYTFHHKGDLEGGFSDTIWYVADHASICKHLEGLRAVVRYKTVPADSSSAGDILEIEIRDDLPPRQQTGASTQPSSTGLKP
jgi:tetratricopeptide (TPR) repeat protein